MIEISNLLINYKCEFNDTNIKYMFQRLISALATSLNYSSYKEDYENISNILKDVCKWFINYQKTKSLSFVKEEDLKKNIYILYDLDGKYLSVDGIFIEESYEWILQLNILKNKEIKKGS